MKQYTSKAKAKTVEDLTPRQQAILAGIVAGKKALEMAKEMGLSYHTINAHIQTIFARTEANSRALLIAWFNGGGKEEGKLVMLKTVEGVYVRVTPAQIVFAMRQIDPREVMSYAQILRAEQRKDAYDRRKAETKKYEVYQKTVKSMLNTGANPDEVIADE